MIGNMKVIGLVGPSGAGKGMFCEIAARKYSVPSIDTDAVYRKITSYRSDCVTALAKRFGEDIVASDGSLDRKMLASKVFGDGRHENDLADLNRISHGYIKAECDRILRDHSQSGVSAVILDAPVLFDSEYDFGCDMTVAVCADENIRLARISERDGITEEYARARIKAQHPDTFYISRSDISIFNNSDIESLEKELDRIADKIFNGGKTT